MPASISNLVTRRLGLKGPRAAQWLQQHDIELPPQPNTWTRLGGDGTAGLIMRLGASEFFLEAYRAAYLDTVAAELLESTPGVYPVPREDRGLLLEGTAADVVLAEVCSFDFANLSTAAQPVVMTLILGVAVIVVPQGEGQRRLYRMWCDPTYGDSLYTALRTIAAETQ